jgi:phosphohistidine phosphatase
MYSGASVKTLLVLRHAKSDRDIPNLSDHERPLNKRGRRDAPRMGRLLHDQRLAPDLIITSTAERARATAEAAAEAAGYKGAIKRSQDLYLAEPGAYFEVLRGVPDACRRVMVVGHNPGVEDLLQLLAGAAETMPTAALAQIDLPIDRWQELGAETRGRLVQLWRPKELG